MKMEQLKVCGCVRVCVCGGGGHEDGAARVVWVRAGGGGGMNMEENMLENFINPWPSCCAVHTGRV